MDCTSVRHTGLSSCLSQVFAGALGALAAMTVLSAVMGWGGSILGWSTTSRCQNVYLIDGPALLSMCRLDIRALERF